MTRFSRFVRLLPASAALAALAVTSVHAAPPRRTKPRPTSTRPAATPARVSTPAAPPAAAAPAQTVSPQDVPQTALNVPRNPTIYDGGPRTVYKPSAIVNGDVITATDVEQRLALIRIANGGNIPPEEAQRLRLQIFSNLIDEKLQVQAAKANSVDVKDAEVDQQFARVAANFKQTPQAFAAYLTARGSSPASMKQQIRGEMAWDRLLGRNVEPFTNVSGEEVQSIIDRLKAQRGSEELWLQEIYLPATPEQMGAAVANAGKMIEQIRQGASFTAYARQYSQASTAVVGGDLGWIRPAQLPPQLAETAQRLQPGQISSPVAVDGGVSVLLLRDRRQVLVADARDAVLSLKQIRLPFPPGTTKDKATEMASRFAQATQAIKGCGVADDVARNLGASIVSRDNIAMRDLPATLQNSLSQLQIGRTTPPFGTPEEGVSVLVLCGREAPQDAGLPSAEQVESKIRQDKVNKRAQRYLRDLRRDAIIDYN